MIILDPNFFRVAIESFMLYHSLVNQLCNNKNACPFIQRAQSTIISTSMNVHYTLSKDRAQKYDH